MNDFLALGPDGRVADREGKTLEFKRDLSSPTGPLRTIVAFANSAGGASPVSSMTASPPSSSPPSTSSRSTAGPCSSSTCL